MTRMWASATGDGTCQDDLPAQLCRAPYENCGGYDISLANIFNAAKDESRRSALWVARHDTTGNAGSHCIFS